MQPKNEADQDTENYPTKLDNQLAYVYMHLDCTDSRPTDGQKDRIADLEKAVDAQLAKLETVIASDVSEFNQQALAVGVFPVQIPK